MDDNDLRKIADLVDERINKALEPVKQKLGELDNGQESLKIGQENLKHGQESLKIGQENLKHELKIINDKLDAHSASLISIEQTLGSYKESYQQNRQNIYRLDTRLTTAEDELAINVPEDLKVPHFAE